MRLFIQQNTPEASCYDKSKIDSHPVGTGPFYLNDYQVNDLIRLKRNNSYWQGQPKMSQIVFDISHRGTGTLAKLLRNECDVLSSPYQAKSRRSKNKRASSLW